MGSGEDDEVTPTLVQSQGSDLSMPAPAPEANSVEELSNGKGEEQILPIRKNDGTPDEQLVVEKVPAAAPEHAESSYEIDASSSTDAGTDSTSMDFTAKTDASMSNGEGVATDPSIGEDADSAAARIEEPRIKTLKDYTEPKLAKSPRGIDLEQIKASPRSEDLTKIKFARFVFNGVSTTVVSRSTTHVDGSQGDVDEGGKSAASPNGEHGDGFGGDEDRREAKIAQDAGAEGMPGIQGREDSDDLNLAKLVSLTAARPRPVAPVVAVDDEAWLAKLRDLSRNCIKKIGSESVGQEYTVQLKAVGKQLDQALREGLGSNISGTLHLEKQRWEAVQRLSAILHETHDAEVGLIHAETRESAETESAIWREEMQALFQSEDAIRKRFEAEREDAEKKLLAQMAGELAEAEALVVQKVWNEASQHEHQLIQQRNAEKQQEEEGAVQDLCKAIEEHEAAVTPSASPKLAAATPTRSPPPSAQRPPFPSATPRRVTSQAQVREAYAHGSPGSLPLEMQANSPRGSPGGMDGAGRLRSTESTALASNLSALNFIPENNLLRADEGAPFFSTQEIPAASSRSSTNDSRLRFLF